MLTVTALVDGEPIGGSNELTIVNPATEEPLGVVQESDAATVEYALQAAQRAQRRWSQRSAVERGVVLRKWATALSAERKQIASLICREIGKPILEAYAEVDFAIASLQYSAEFDRRIEGLVLPPEQRDQHLWIAPEPLGVVAAIVTWNAPVALTVRKLAPALITGNAVVVKPHEAGSLAALEVIRIGLASGLPAGVANVVVGGGATVGAALASSAIPRLVTFTGGRRAAQAIAAHAAVHLPALSLEMGGKAPFIVLDDADLDAAAAAAIAAKIRNCGQSCVANERLLVHRAVAAALTEKLVAGMSTVKVGDPADRSVQVGPKVSNAELERVERLVDNAKSAGAVSRVGGFRLKQGGFARGFWYAPTLLANISPDMQVMQDEIFGPVLPMMEVESLDEGIAIANNSRYGLAACVFTNDLRHAMRAVREIQCGEVYINRAPGESIHGFHSGWKDSGIGGDDGKYGLQQYLRHKTTYLRA